MKYLVVCFICLFSLNQALPTVTVFADNSTAAVKNPAVHSFASDVSHILGINLLKSNIDIDSNQVYSPLGIATVLAILAEGSSNETYDEFNKILGFPWNRSNLRESFDRVLRSYQSQDYGINPTFKTWFYVYRNYTVREEFKQILKNNYYVEVRDINSNDYDWNEPEISLDLLESTTMENSKDVIGFETLKKINVNQNEEGQVALVLNDDRSVDALEKEASKFDRDVDDKQYVESPVIRNELAHKKQCEQINSTEAVIDKQMTLSVSAASRDEEKLIDEAKAPAKKREGDINLLENETVQDDEKIDALHKNYDSKDGENVTPQKISTSPLKDIRESNEPQKVTLPLHQIENSATITSSGDVDVLKILESHLGSLRRLVGARSLFRKDDIGSALSANSITGRNVRSKTKMLLFNGLYYRGNWAHPFQELQSGRKENFYMTSDETMRVATIHSHGKYAVGNLQHLNAMAIAIPYENQRYSLLVVVPNEIEGLRSLIEKLQAADLKSIRSHLQEKQVHVSLPKFQVEETSRSEGMLKKLGLRNLFSKEKANLSLMTDDQDIYVDEIVQFVNVRVDEGGSSENGITASDNKGRNSAINSDALQQTIEINRPFVYFIVDNKEDFVILSGKIYSPELQENIPLTIDEEFKQP